VSSRPVVVSTLTGGSKSVLQVGKPSGCIRRPGQMARVPAGASHATVSRTMDSQWAGRPHAALRADRAPMPQVAKPRAGRSSDQPIVSPGSQRPVTDVDPCRHRHQPYRSVWFRHASGIIKLFRPPLNQRMPGSGTTGRRAAVTVGARRLPRSAPTRVASSRASRPRRTNTSLWLGQVLLSRCGDYRLVGGLVKDALRAPLRGRAAPGS
jgi:hypothetical protein